MLGTAEAIAATLWWSWVVSALGCGDSLAGCMVVEAGKQCINQKTITSNKILQFQLTSLQN